MQKMFLIYGVSGEWSDRTEWPIRVVASEQRAQELVEQFTMSDRITQARAQMKDDLIEKKLDDAKPSPLLELNSQEDFHLLCAEWDNRIYKPISDEVRKHVDSLTDDKIDVANLQWVETYFSYREVDVEL